MHALYPMADYQAEVARRQEEMSLAAQSHLARECCAPRRAVSSLPLSLLNFILLLFPLFRR